jgi:hypothetical protein
MNYEYVVDWKKKAIFILFLLFLAIYFVCLTKLLILVRFKLVQLQIIGFLFLFYIFIKVFITDRFMNKKNWRTNW